MDEKTIDVGKKLLDAKGNATESLRKIKSVEREVAETKEHVLAAFAKLQLAMSQNFSVQEWPVSSLRKYAEAILDHFKHLESLQAKMIVAMSPVSDLSAVIPTPAELEGARIRAEVEKTTSSDE